LLPASINKAPSAGATAAPAAHSSDEPRFKETMEHFAQQHNLLFLPGRRKHPAGKPTYLFGSIDVTVDKDILFAYQRGTWTAVSLSELLALAQASHETKSL